MGFEGFPLVVGWELTLRCNLRCRHCASSAADPRPGELTLEESLAVCDQFPALLVQEVDFTGGEPLLSPHWRPIFARLGELGIRTQVITNGLALTPRIFEDLRDVGVVGIGVSLDGIEATHDRIRERPGLFRTVLDGIDRAQAAGFVVTVITTVTALNLRELPSMRELLCSRGIGHWQVQPIFPLGRAQGATELELTSAGYMELARFVRDSTPIAARAGLRMKPSDPYGYYTEFDTRETAWRGCPAGRAACGITSDGKIKGCLSLPDEFVEGDLRERDLWDIWFDAQAFPYTRRFDARRMGPNCLGCQFGEQCMGGCTAMSYGSTGLVHNNPFCFHGILCADGVERSAAPQVSRVAM